jgi:hypothetical protein
MELVKILVPLPTGDVASGEQLWAEDLGEGLFEIRSVPSLAYDLSLGDVVKAPRIEGENRPVFSSRVRRSSNATIRMSFNDPSCIPEQFPEVERAVTSAGGSIEGHAGYRALSVPQQALPTIQRLLIAGETSGVWDFEVSDA